LACLGGHRQVMHALRVRHEFDEDPQAQWVAQRFE
jgi:hypothetical protein